MCLPRAIVPFVMDCTDTLCAIATNVCDLRAFRAVSRDWREVAEVLILQRANREGLSKYMKALLISRRVGTRMAINYLYKEPQRDLTNLYTCARCGSSTPGILMCKCTERDNKLRPRIALNAVMGVVVCCGATVAAWKGVRP